MTSQNPKPQSRFDRGVSTVLVGLSSNVLLAAIKIVTGIFGNSYALMADGIESTLDIFSSVVVLGGIKISSLPADENHPYGHGKAESLAAMTVSLILLMERLLTDFPTEKSNLKRISLIMMTPMRTMRVKTAGVW